MEALGAGNVVLESYNIGVVAPISTPGGGNDGAFRGILRNTNDIAAFRLSSGYNVIDDLAFSRVSSVPEPTSLAIFVIGALGMVVRHRRKQKQT